MVFKHRARAIVTLICVLGSTVSLECNADGYPRPVIKWRREKGEKIKILGKNGRMKKVDRFIGSKLTIHDVETADMGSYLCMADNGVPPIVSKRIFLYVQCNQNTHCLKINQNVSFEKARKIDYFWHFNELLSTQNINIARFARNVE